MQTNLSNYSREQLEAMVANLTKAAERKLSLRVTVKKPDGTGTDGAISMYGLGRFPITLYAGQWERLLDAADQVRAFIAANETVISRK